jgi:hypothetical protein
MSRISTLGRFFISMSLVAGSFALAPHMQAQQWIITTRVPFAFSANNQQFAAGQYEIRPLNSFLLQVSNTITHQTQFLIVSPSGMRDIQYDGRLLFHRYNGSEYYLSQVWIPGRNGFSELKPNRRERQTMHTAKLASLSGTVLEAFAAPAR